MLRDTREHLVLGNFPSFGDVPLPTLPAPTNIERIFTFMGGSQDISVFSSFPWLA